MEDKDRVYAKDVRLNKTQEGDVMLTRKQLIEKIKRKEILTGKGWVSANFNWKYLTKKDLKEIDRVSRFPKNKLKKVM